MSRLTLIFEYAGDTFKVEVPPSQRIEGAWHEALAHFRISRGDTRNLGLFRDGTEVSRRQSFEEARIPDHATLRIRPRVQRNG